MGYAPPRRNFGSSPKLKCADKRSDSWSLGKRFTPVAGLIGSVNSYSSSGLVGFLTGSAAATANGTVEQFRNNLTFDYGEIINGALSDGTIFDIRVNGPKDFEFGPNLSFKSNVRPGLVDTGSVLSLEASQVRKRLEQNDLARIAYGLLLASKGEIDENQLNNNPAYSARFAVDVKDAFDRLNIDVDRPFRVNGVDFEYADNHIRINSRPGHAALGKIKRDPEIEELRRRLDKKNDALSVGDKLEIPAEDALVSDLIAYRDYLERNYTYVAYNFDKNTFVGSNNFSDTILPLASIPDGFFFGANIAYQFEDVLRKNVPQVALNELFPSVTTYFGSLAVGAITGLPAQLKEEFETHAGQVLFNFYGDEKKVNKILDQVMPKFNSMVENVLVAVSEVPRGAELAELRKGLGIAFAGGTYSVSKFNRVY